MLKSFIQRRLRTREFLAILSALIIAGLTLIPLTPANAEPILPTPPKWSETNPLAGKWFYNNPQSTANQKLIQAKAEGWDTRAVTALTKIAKYPNSTWIGNDYDALGAENRVREITTAATAAGKVPVLVLYNIPYRGICLAKCNASCGRTSDGNEATPEEYKNWMRGIVKGLAHRKAVIILEPDALAMLGCLTPDMQKQRVKMIADATALLSYTKAATYIEAGGYMWIDSSIMASRLQAAGIKNARGFAVNVSRFHWTATTTKFAEDLSAKLGGAKYVIDTSRNGKGPTTGSYHWCNPANAGLGSPPRTANLLGPNADAYLWIKTVVYSDGNCRPGEPIAGEFYLDYAITLSENAAY